MTISVKTSALRDVPPASNDDVSRAISTPIASTPGALRDARVGSSSHIELHNCYWAVLDAPGIHPGPLPEILHPMLSEDIPEPIDDVHAVCTPTKRGLLVCAVPKRRLRQVPSEASESLPASLPSGWENAAKLESLNLLVGSFEPPAVTRARRRLVRNCVGAAIVATLGIGVGMNDLRLKSEFQTKTLRDTTMEAVHSVVHQNASRSDVLDELAVLRREAAAMAARPSVPDAAVDLAALLAAWPVDSRCDVRSLSVNSAGATSTVEVPTEETSKFLAELKPPNGWALDEPRLQGVSREVRTTSQVTLQWRRANTGRAGTEIKP